MSRKVLVGVKAIINVRNEDGCDATSEVQSKLRDLGAQIISSKSRASSATHLIFARGDEATLKSAKASNTIVVNTLWLNDCHFSRKREDETAEIYQVLDIESSKLPGPIIESKEGKRKKDKKDKRKKSTYETISKEDETLPSPSEAAFSSTQQLNQEDGEEDSKRGKKKARKSQKGRKSAKSRSAPIAEEDEDEVVVAAADLKTPTSRGGRASSEKKAEGKKARSSTSPAVAGGGGKAGGEKDDEKSESEEEFNFGAHVNDEDVNQVGGEEEEEHQEKVKAAAKEKEASKKKAVVEEEEVEEDGTEDDEEENRQEKKVASAATTKEKKTRKKKVVVEEDGKDGTEDEEENRQEKKVASAATKEKKTRKKKVVAGEEEDGTEDEEENQQEKKNASASKSVEKKRRRSSTASVEGTREKETWACKNCSFENRARLLKCEMCASAKNGKLSDEVVKAQQSLASVGSSKASKGGAKDKKKKKDPLVESSSATNATATSSSKAKASSSAAGGEKKRKSFSSAANEPKKKKAKKQKEKEEQMEEEVDDGKQFVIGLSGTDEREWVRAVVNGLNKVVAAKAEEDEDEEEEGGRIHAKVSMADDPSTPYTHLLVPAQGECRRTLKVLFALARGIWILKSDWLVTSENEGEWAPEAACQVPKYARRRSSGKRGELFAGETIYLGNNDKPPRPLLTKLINAVGGEVVRSLGKATICITQDEAWVTENLNKPSEAANHLRQLISDDAVVTPVFLFDSIENGVVPKDRSSYLVNSALAMDVEV